MMRLAAWSIAAAAIAMTLGACGGSGGDDQANVTPAIDLDAEVDRIFPDGGPRFGTLNRDQVKRMLDPEDDGPFYMVNLITYRDRADYQDGRETDLTGREADALYDPQPILAEIGAQVIYVADVERQVVGDDTVWERIAIARYPSRSAFIEMIQRDDFRALTVHKDAGVEKSVVLVAVPIDLGVIPAADPAMVPYPAGDGDAPFTMVHVLDFREAAEYEDGRETDLDGREALALYEQNAGPVAVPLGVRPQLWLEVEGAFVGDGGDWNEVRLNTFPSHATFDALTSDASWAMGLEHRVAGLVASYSLMTLPLVDNVASASEPSP